MEGDNGDIRYSNFSKLFDAVSHYCLQEKWKTLVFLKSEINCKYCKIFFDRILKVIIGKNYSHQSFSRISTGMIIVFNIHK